MITYSEAFRRLCPWFMSIGMTYDEFWYDDPRKARYYREAYEWKRENKNTEMYLQAVYMHDAFRAVIDNFAFGLGGGKGVRPKPFRDAPIAFTEREKELERQRNIQHTLAWVEQGQNG